MPIFRERFRRMPPGLRRRAAWTRADIWIKKGKIVSDKTVFAYEKEMYEHSTYQLGPRTSHSIRTDAKHLLFTLSRYKFCAKMLEGKQRVLEVGCGDAIGAPIMLQSVGSLYAVDIEPLVIEQNKARNEFGSRLSFACCDFTREHPQEVFDAAYCLDVIEHIEPEKEGLFLSNLAACVAEDGVCIIGTPNIAASIHASEISRNGHINLKSGKTLRDSLAPYFKNIFIFSMNDEVVHTGYTPMAHFLLALCAGRR